VENKSSFHSWRTPSPKIKDSEISYEHSADVVVIGLGNAGTPAVRAAAEAGASVIGIEKMTEERFWVYGRDIGHINSDFLASRGVPKVDPIELFNEWMRRSGNRANPKLVMQFCQKSGENISWYMEPFTQKQKGSMFIKYYPLGTRFPGEASGQKFWGGDANFDDKWKFGSPAQVEISQEEAKKRGIKLRFGMDASQLE
jgi:fumarate reductase flavoprotein subunit